MDKNENETFGFALVTGQDAVGTVHKTRSAISLINDQGGEVLDISYQVVGGNSHVVSIVFTINKEMLDETNSMVDNLEPPLDSGTTIRRNREPGSELRR